MIMLISFEIIVFAIVSVFVHMYAEKSLELDVRSSLSRQINSLSDAIVEEENDLVIDEDKIEKNFPNMYVSIINYNGEVQWGKTPEGDNVDSKQSMAPRTITADGYSYYYIDRDIKHTMGADEFVRAYVRKDDIEAKYLPFKLGIYSIVLAVFFILTIAMYYALRRIKRSFDEIKDTAEKIGVSEDFDHRLNPNEHYKEIASLIEANNRMLDRMGEMFQQQEQFSSDVAHELRTPISVIKAQCQYALNNYELNDEQKNSFGVILRQSNKMQELVSTLLELSRLDLNDSSIESEVIDLNEIAAAVCEAEQYKSESKNIKFDIKSENLSETKGDISLVTIAVSNLISNAVKFSGDNSVISVETGENDNSVFVKVRDNGKGMTEEEKKKVFTRFFKSDSSRNSSGYGLGIPLALKIAEKHGGTIEVESEINRGSCFTLYLSKNL